MAIGLLLVAGCASTDRYANLPGLGESDRSFMVQAYESAMSATAAAELAQQRGHAIEVRRTGRAIADAERQLMHELYDLGQEKGMPLPNTPGYDGQTLVTNLEHKSEADFDHAFIESVGTWERRAAGIYDQASQHAVDPDVRDFAAHHLATARDRAVAVMALNAPK